MAIYVCADMHTVCMSVCVCVCVHAVCVRMCVGACSVCVCVGVRTCVCMHACVHVSDLSIWRVLAAIPSSPTYRFARGAGLLCFGLSTRSAGSVILK